MTRRIALITTSPPFVQPFVRDAALHRRLGIEIALAVYVHPSMRRADRIRDLGRTVAREARINATSFAAQLVHYFAFRPLARTPRPAHDRAAALAALREGRASIDVPSANDPRVAAALRAHDIALGLVIGSDVLTPRVLDTIALPLYNLHTSDPAFARGKVPAFWEILDDRDALVLTLHELAPAVDAGAVVRQRAVTIAWRPTLAATLRATRARIAQAIPGFLDEGLRAVLDGTARPRPAAAGPVRTTPTVAQLRAAARVCRRRSRAASG